MSHASLRVSHASEWRDPGNLRDTVISDAITPSSDREELRTVSISICEGSYNSINGSTNIAAISFIPGLPSEV